MNELGFHFGRIEPVLAESLGVAIDEALDLDPSRTSQRSFGLYETGIYRFDKSGRIALDLGESRTNLLIHTKNYGGVPESTGYEGSVIRIWFEHVAVGSFGAGGYSEFVREQRRVRDGNDVGFEKSGTLVLDSEADPRIGILKGTFRRGVKLARLSNGSWYSTLFKNSTNFSGEVLTDLDADHDHRLFRFDQTRSALGLEIEYVRPTDEMLWDLVADISEFSAQWRPDTNRFGIVDLNTTLNASAGPLHIPKIGLALAGSELLVECI